MRLDIILLLGLAATAGAEEKQYSRTIPIGPSARQPRFTLDISAKDRVGSIRVKNSANTTVQTLTCDLFRDWSGPVAVTPELTRQVVDYHQQIFVNGVRSLDVDFDNVPDIVAPRDFGAKWTKYCVWVYDPAQNRFVQDTLTREMEELVNLTVESRQRQVVAYTIGPVNPTRDEYRIESGRRLVPVRSCELETGPPGTNRSIKTKIRIDGQTISKTKTVSQDCADVCGDACPAAVPSRSRLR